MGNTTIIAEPGERTIVLRRVFSAPRQLVYEAWTKPEHLLRWWGPRGCVMPICKMDVRPGGSYRFVVQMGEGGYGLEGEYVAIDPPEKLIYTERLDGAPGIQALVTMVLTEEAGMTTLTSTITHDTVEGRDAHLGAGMKEGASQSMDRLAEHLVTLAKRGEHF